MCGDAKQYVVTVEPAHLQRAGVTLSDVVDAVSKNNSTAGGSVVTRGSMSFVVRGRGAVQDEKEIGRIFIKSVGGTPIVLKDVARIDVEAKIPTGIFGMNDRNGVRDNTIEGLVTLRKGENPSTVLVKLKEAIDELNTTGLPPGVRLEPFYDRSQLIDTTPGSDRAAVVTRRTAPSRSRASCSACGFITSTATAPSHVTDR